MVVRDAGRRWSGRRDLNPRPPAPKAGALPSCATSRDGDRYAAPASVGHCGWPSPTRARDSVTAMPTVRVAVFDLGSSSFHLMVVDASRDGSLTPVLRRRSFLHLGTEVARTGAVPADRAALGRAHRASLARGSGGGRGRRGGRTGHRRPAGGCQRHTTACPDGTDTRKLDHPAGRRGGGAVVLPRPAGRRLGRPRTRAGTGSRRRQPRGRCRHDPPGGGGGQRPARDGADPRGARYRRPAEGRGPPGDPRNGDVAVRVGPHDARRSARGQEPGHRERGDGQGPRPARHVPPSPGNPERILGDVRASIRSNCRPASSTSWPIDWPPWTSMPGWPSPAFRHGEPRCSRSVPRSSRPWFGSSTSVGWWSASGDYVKVR